jgi:hypothetical protein
MNGGTKDIKINKQYKRRILSKDSKFSVSYIVGSCYGTCVPQLLQTLH